MKQYNILSLFGGIECGKVACDRAGLLIDQYFSSEINPYAIKIATKNHPIIKHLGDVKNITCANNRFNDKTFVINYKIDLLMGGSPCQELRPGRDGLRGKTSGLFYEYVRILNEIKAINPDVLFLFENVTKLSKEDKSIITQLLGVNPILINAELVSPQSRPRYYWTNISAVTQPKDSKLYLRDILENEVDQKYYLSQRMIDGFNNRLKNNKARGAGFSHNITSGYEKTKTIQARYYKDGKECIYFNGGKLRKLTPVECERLQGLPDNYTNCVSDTQRYISIGNGWNVDVISYILSHI